MDAGALIISQLQSLDARLERIEADGQERGRRLWEEVNAMRGVLIGQEHRMANIEKSVAGAQPTIDDVKAMKQKAAGAGWLGRMLWRIGGWVLAGAVGIYASWENLMAVMKAITGR